MPGPTRRFPPPWHVRTTPDGFHVCDANGGEVCFVVGYDEARRAAVNWKYMSTDDARRIALAIAKLPDLMMKRDGSKPGLND